MKKLYISLPISNYDLAERKEHAEYVQNMLYWTYKPNEWVIITPFDVCPETDKYYSYYMGRDIEMLLECDVVYFCKDWQNSKGCMTEFEVAKIYGKEIIFE